MLRFRWNIPQIQSFVIWYFQSRYCKHPRRPDEQRNISQTAILPLMPNLIHVVCIGIHCVIIVNNPRHHHEHHIYQLKDNWRKISAIMFYGHSKVTEHVSMNSSRSKCIIPDPVSWNRNISSHWEFYLQHMITSLRRGRELTHYNCRIYIPLDWIIISISLCKKAVSPVR